MSNKILIIGQAPPAQAQKVPYDTTMLYDWLALAGSKISKDNALEKCSFFAVCDVFTGFGSGGHQPPTLAQMQECYIRYLEHQIAQHHKIWVVGAVAKKFLSDKLHGKIVLHTIHPSKRCYFQFMQNKEAIINSIANFLGDIPTKADLAQTTLF